MLVMMAAPSESIYCPVSANRPAQSTTVGRITPELALFLLNEKVPHSPKTLIRQKHFSRKTL